MVIDQNPEPEIKKDQEAFPPQLPENPQALEKEKRRIVRTNVIVIGAVIIIFIAVVLYFVL